MQRQEEEEIQAQEEEEVQMQEAPVQAQKGEEEEKPDVAAGLKGLSKGIESEEPKPKIGTSKVKAEGKKGRPPLVEEY